MEVSWPSAGAGALAIAIASLLRGLTGFGFAIVAMPLLSLVFPPALAVPIVTLLQIPSGMQTIMTDWGEIDRRSAGLVWLAGLPALLPGLYLVSSLSPDLMRACLGFVVLSSALMLARGWRFAREPNISELAIAGALSGFMQGAVAVPGPPVIVLVLASSWQAARCRATLSFMFFLLGVSSLTLGLFRDVFSQQSLLLGVLFAPGLFAAQTLGSRLFTRVDVRRYRSLSFALVALTGAVVLAKGLIGLL